MVSLLISPSRSLWGSAAELVGVVALDISLKELTSALIGTEAAPRRLYESGYAFVWDASGTGVVHKNYPAEHSAGGSAPGGGAVDIARLDSCGGAADCSGSLSFVEQFQEGILAKGRTTSTFHYVWRGQTWHYSFLPVKGTTYMMALTVEQTEVTKVPDAMVARCERRMSEAPPPLVVPQLAASPASDARLRAWAALRAPLRRDTVRSQPPLNGSTRLACATKVASRRALLHPGKGRVDAMAGITVVAFLLALGVLALATRWFDRRFASPVRKLHALVSRAAPDYQKDVSPLLRDSAASKELRAIIDNLSPLWVALRFGNAKYHGNNKVKEPPHAERAVLAVWCATAHEPWPPEAGSPGCWLRYVLGTSHCTSQSPMGSRDTDRRRLRPRLQDRSPATRNPQEATNYVAALKLVEKTWLATGSTRGLGICHNNLANLAGQSKEVREQLQLSPEHHFEQAAAPTFSI